MAISSAQSAAWALAARQHGVISRRQLLEIGFSVGAIYHRVAKGRLHSVRRGVYAVGRPGLTPEGKWMAAVLACGPDAALSHDSAGALWGIRAMADRSRAARIEVSVPATSSARQPDITVHRRACLHKDDVRVCKGIPVTSPALTLVDLATRLQSRRLEAAVTEADKLDLIDPPALRTTLGKTAPRPGVAVLRNLLDRRTFRLTDSDLERRFLALVRRAGLPSPDTQQVVLGHTVDFCWRDLGLIVETDGLRYHRTPVQQARDRRRDQDFAAVGLTCLRFTHAQVAYEQGHVERTLAAVTHRLPQTVEQ